MKVLLITPPMIQINGPYPATPYLTSFLKKIGHQATQIDMSIELALELFSSQGLLLVKNEIEKHKSKQLSDGVYFFLEAFNDYSSTIDPVIKFLQGRDSSLALRLANRTLVPEGPRFATLDEHGEHLLSTFGSMGLQDRAKYIASLYLDDLADIIREGVDPHFGFSRYGEKLASAMISFNPLKKHLDQKDSLIDKMTLSILERKIKGSEYDLVCLTAPFPGNVLSAFKIGQWFKTKTTTQVALGGGYVNTELRFLEDSRIFDYIDYLCFDDGEQPIKKLLEVIGSQRTPDKLLRTWYRENGKIVKGSSSINDIPFKEITAPTYEGLPLDQYISLLEMPNPMHRMWSDFRWNKLILAHGCYWKKCTFCDINLDYISRFEPQKATTLVDQIESMIKETGSSGFHFVDEAAPPALLKNLSEELIRRGVKSSWWGNLRFDTLFTKQLAQLMADAGCVAVTGGLEVASPRLLDLINKGISIEQTAIVTKSFVDSGIFVHAYLMYGFPSQTVQETVDSLEIVRQLFLNGCLHSAFWHRFTATPHSPVGKNPADFGIKIKTIKAPVEGLFAFNDLDFVDSVKTDHDQLGEGLRKALYNYMHGIGLEEDCRAWFDFQTPKSTVNPNYLRGVIKKSSQLAK